MFEKVDTDAAIQPEPISPNDTVLCPRCSNGFECGVRAERCWCADVTLDTRVRGDLVRFYDGCLCPDCLRTIEDARPPRGSVWRFLLENWRRKRAV